MGKAGPKIEAGAVIFRTKALYNNILVLRTQHHVEDRERAPGLPAP